MKIKSKRSSGSSGSKNSLNKLDSKDRSFIKSFGELHPINEIDDVANRKIQIVKDVDDDENEDDVEVSGRKFQKNSKKSKFNKFNKKEHTTSDKGEDEKDGENLLEDVEEVVAPYQMLLKNLNVDSNQSLSNDLKRKLEKIKSDKKKKSKKSNKTEEAKLNDEDEDEDDDEKDDEDADENSTSSEIDEENEEEEENIEIAKNIGAYNQEVLCKDNNEQEDNLQNDPFSIHFEKGLNEKQIETLKKNISQKQFLTENFKWSGLGSLTYNSYLEEAKFKLDSTIDFKNNNLLKQRILERLNESIDYILGKDFKNNQETEDPEKADTEKDSENSQEYNLSKKQLNILNIILNYSDLYHADNDLKSDSETKFAYAIHALNHVLKTRSRIIAHNDKLKQNKSNLELEYRDQGLTRPKVLILVPFRKHALKLIQIFISLIMRKSEEFVSNKKRFFDAFGPAGEDSIDESTKIDNIDDSNENKTSRSPEFYALFSGNIEDHFKFGLSVSKKSLKLYTQFYSSDIIIASPLGLKSIIGAEGDSQRDYDFLSSIELLIVDNADILMMQNWEHVTTIFENLHLQPKKSHDVDFSRVRSWLLDGHAPFYRQTLIFSQIPAPPINNLFNKYCQNFSGKFQLNLLENSKYKLGTICQIGFQLGQVFHRIDCDSPIDLPDARFNFFIDKILPQFRDEMMSHTLIFIPSYFDYVKLRNYFKKNDISSMNLTEYNDDKTNNRSRYLFYHGKVHFMLLTERFHFYKRYKIRGINHIIFYELPHYAEYYSSFCNFLPDAKRKNAGLESFSSTVLYSKYDVQKLCAVVGQVRAAHMINSEKTVHMFMIE